MKMLTLMLILALPALAAADDKKQQGGRLSTQAEDTWFKLQVLAQEGPSARARGLDIADPTALQQYVEESRERLNSLSRAFWDDLCTNRPAYESDHQRLINRWELYAQDKQAMKQSIIDGLSGVIGEANADAFFSFVASGKLSITAGFDATDMRSDKARRQTMLSRGCERGEQP
jgi:allantoicase